MTDKLISEVKSQFPQFAEGDIKGMVIYTYIPIILYSSLINTIYCRLYIVVSCRHYFQTLLQREKRKDKITADQVKQRRKQRKLRVSSWEKRNIL